jgi:hypothetical protein
MGNFSRMQLAEMIYDEKQGVKEYNGLFHLEPHFMVLAKQEYNHYKFLIKLWNKLTREKDFNDKYTFNYIVDRYPNINKSKLNTVIVYSSSYDSAVSSLWSRFNYDIGYVEYKDFIKNNPQYFELVAINDKIIKRVDEFYFSNYKFKNELLK